MQRILIIAKQSLGDIILQLGVMQALKLRNPAAQIYVACYAKYQPALERQSVIAEIIPLDLPSGKKRGFFNVLGEIKRRRFDVILSFGTSKQAVWWGFLARIKIRVGTANQRFGFLLTRSLRERANELNSFEYYFKLAQLFAPGLIVAYPNIPIDKGETQKLRASLYKQKVARKFIVWHIGSSLEEKRYPVFQIVETLRLFSKKRITLPIVFAGGRGDERFLEELEATVNAANIRTVKVFFADGIQFQATAALFSLAHLVIANDAAPRHIAAAIGKTSLALLPNHRKRRWQVYSEKQKAYFLYADTSPESLSVDAIEPNEVAEMVKRIS